VEAANRTTSAVDEKEEEEAKKLIYGSGEGIGAKESKVDKEDDV